MRTRAGWLQMVVATVLVTGLPAALVWALSAAGVIGSVWAGVAVAAGLALVVTSAGSAYWRRHAAGDVLFSDLMLWGWLRRRRTLGRIGRADDLLKQAGGAETEPRAALLRELGAALDAHDPYLDGHSRRVARYATMIAHRIDLPDAQVERLQSAAAVHDVGKLRVADEVVHKPGRLTDEEFALMRQHAAAGAAMVQSVGDPVLTAAVRSHHERWDGSGYPDGLAGARIPLEARIISVADTFDAITSARPYRAATPHAKALSVIDEEAGHQLDPTAAQAFISCYSDRRGAALWAGLASLPRQLASRLSISPAELSGALTAALAAPLVVVTAAAASAALPITGSPAGDGPAAEQAAQISQATPTPSAPAPVRATAPAGGSPTPGRTGTPASATPVATAPPGAGAQSASAPQAEPERAVTPAPRPTPTPTLVPLPEIAAPLPVATAGPPTPAATPAPAEPTPTPALTAGPPSPTPPPVTPTPTPTATPPDLLPPPPHTAEDCKDGGWIILGYDNQGQCIAEANDTP